MAAGRDVEKVTNVQLCDVSFDDLQTFFEMQLDPIANRMAAFTAKNPSDRPCGAQNGFAAPSVPTRGRADIAFNERSHS